MKGLTHKQRAFVEAYTGAAEGNATEAAAMAGYKGNRRTLEAVGRENLGKPRVASAIEEINERLSSARIATAEERQAFYTAILRGEGLEPHVTPKGDVVDAGPTFKDRLKAGELLGKMQGDFIEKVDVQVTGADVRFVYPDNGRVPPPPPKT